MLQNKTNIKNKIIKYLTCNGKKEISKKIFNKILKRLQKISLIKAKELINISFILVTPIFKIHKIIIKRKKKSIIETPVFINLTKFKFFSAIKFLLVKINNNNKNNFYINFSNKIFNNISIEESLLQLKNNIQKQALVKKHLFYYYK